MQNLSNMIWGMARLAEHPGPEVMAKCLQKLEEVLESGKRQEERDQTISNILWALTALDELQPDFVNRVSVVGP